MPEKAPTLKEKLLQTIARAEHSLSKAKVSLKERLHLLEPIMIQPYYGFGHERYVYLKGRVLENEGVAEKQEGTSTYRHIRNTYKRYESDEIPCIRLKASYAGKEVELETDDEGYFEVEFHFEEPLDFEKVGTRMNLQLLESKTEHDQMEAEGVLFIPDPHAEYGVISDMDDTVLVSQITHFLGRIKMMMLNDATERVPFPGIAAFFRALCTGCDNRGKNPLFYVSGSEWNIFDLLVSFLNYHGVPDGPLLLRDKGVRVNRSDLKTGEAEYKRNRIRHILQTYPGLNFICIGDSGQHDPEIYQKVVEEFPGRILGIYIRDVTSDKRDAEVKALAEEVKKMGPELLLIDETLTAAEHAFRMKWINEEQLEEVRKECEKDVGQNKAPRSKSGKDAGGKQASTDVPE